MSAPGERPAAREQDARSSFAFRTPEQRPEVLDVLRHEPPAIRAGPLVELGVVQGPEPGIGCDGEDILASIAQLLGDHR